jgi:4-aminobutyrate aminotransferase/(S)-3-amino-2-methylpropionate transaminase
MGRAEAWVAIEHDGVVPAIVTIAKGVAGGMPLATVTAPRT